MKGYMIDSTYTNACDPNSMRDNGAVRNCVYVSKVNPDTTTAAEYAEKRTQKHQSYDRFLVPTAVSNKTFYSFGGKKNVRKENVFYTDDLVTPQLLHNDTLMRRERSNAYPKVRNELVNDYTKNISQSIFSPGIVNKDMVPEHQCNPRTAQLKNSLAVQPGTLRPNARAQSATIDVRTCTKSAAKDSTRSNMKQL